MTVIVERLVCPRCGCDLRLANGPAEYFVVFDYRQKVNRAVCPRCSKPLDKVTQ